MKSWRWYLTQLKEVKLKCGLAEPWLVCKLINGVLGNEKGPDYEFWRTRIFKFLTGSSCPKFRAKTRALAKWSNGPKRIREYCWYPILPDWLHQTFVCSTLLNLQLTASWVSELLQPTTRCQQEMIVGNINTREVSLIRTDILWRSNLMSQ